MSRSFVMGLDLGGSGIRVLLLDTENGETHHAAHAVRAHGAPGLGGLGLDIDLDAVTAALAGACGDVLALADATPNQIAAVATSSMRFGTVVLGPKGEVILAVPNKDARAAMEAITLASQRGEALLETAGHWPNPVHPAARLQWLAARRGEEFGRAESFFSLSDWLNWRLCGVRASDPAHASASLLFDLQRGDWSDSVCAELGVPMHLLPPLVESGTQLGTVNRAAAQATGLAEGTPVVMGGADTQCGLLGTGAVSPGDAAVIAGTTAPLQVVTQEPRIDPAGRTWTQRHCVPGCWVVESNAGPAGDALAWLARLLHPQASHPEARLFGEAAQSEPGAAGLFSHFGVQVLNGREMGVPVGQLTLTHLTTPDDPDPRRHLSRAFVEGLAFGVRANLAQASQVAEAVPKKLHLGGGMSRSATWSQILADVVGRPVPVPSQPESTCMGAALCAAVAAGVADDLAGAARRYVGIARTELPDADRSARYTDNYPKWNTLRNQQGPEAGTFATPGMLQALAATAPTAATTQKLRILSAADLDEHARTALSSLGDLEYASFRDKKRLLTGPSLVEALRDVEVFITEIDIVDAASLAALPQLRVVAACRGDAVNIDVPACTAYGIPVLYSPGRNADAVADLTLAFLLALARQLPEASQFLRQPDVRAGDMGKMGQAFSTLRGHELWGRTIGLVGLGAVGRKVAARLAPFHARVLVADPFVSPEQAALCDAERVDLDTLLRESDFVSLHAPVTADTEEMIGAEQLARMKPGAALVNTARAALTDEDALVAALASGQLGGLAVDTFSVEPPGSDHPLLAFHNVIATPHVGGNTFEVSAHQGAIVARDLGRLLRGETPEAILNPEVLEGLALSEPRRSPNAATLAGLGDRPGPAVTDLQRDKKASKAKGRPRQPDDGRPATAPPPASETLPEAADTRAIAGAMQSVLQRFAEKAAADPALAAFAEGKDVTLHFLLHDLGVEVWLRLREGTVSGDLGAAPEDADVQLRMRAAVLHGMFRATLNPMEAAMAGDIAFTGDAAKAMTLQHMQGDLERLYQEAIAEVGDPGDLDAVSSATAAGAAARVTPAEPGDVRLEITRAVEELYAQELITATGGNVSARIGSGDEVWITPSQLFKGDLTPELMVRVDLDGHSLDPGSRSASSEWGIHCALYKARPAVKAVVHAHAPHATILANTGLPFLPISTEAAFFGDIARVPFIMPGTPDLAAAVCEAMADDWAVLMVNHGLIVAGRSLRRAADMVEIIDRSAEVILGCYAVGREPPTLPENVVKQLRELGDLVA